MPELLPGQLFWLWKLGVRSLLQLVNKHIFICSRTRDSAHASINGILFKKTVFIH
jgi:hypothetical protein